MDTGVPDKAGFGWVPQAGDGWAPAGSPVHAEFQRASLLLKIGHFGHAEALCREILQTDPRHFEALHLLGGVRLQSGDAASAIDLIGRAVAINPGFAVAHANLGNAMQSAGRHAEALQSYERALELEPEFWGVLFNLGNVQMQLGRPQEALGSYERALQLKPDYVEALNNRGNALRELGQPQAALTSFDQALGFNPDFHVALGNRSNVMLELGQPAAALVGCDRALELKPDYAEALYIRGNALLDLHRIEEALTCFDRTLKIDSGHCKALNNRGTALVQLNRPGDALRSFQQALMLKSDYLDALDNCGTTCGSLRRWADAILYFAQLLQLAPDHRYVAGNLAHARMHCCDWSNRTRQSEEIVASIRKGVQACLPLSLLAISDDPGIQLQCARLFAGERYGRWPERLWQGERYGHERLRVGYMSADFREHPVSYLLAGLLERHDRSRFEVFAIAVDGAEDAMRARVRAGCEHFIEVAGWSEPAIAARVRELEIDILVDLSGYTGGAKLGVLAARPAPVQVSFLGYPGTLGAPFADYLIADEIVVPVGDERFYAEHIVRLPHSYLVTDDRREIGATPTRGEAGLPESGFVFCGFANSFKLTPVMFDIWMRLLGAVEGSVLWLSHLNDSAQNNLRREAQARGIAAERLIFAPPVPNAADHLARHRCADLYLDTLPYNAHSTAADALWAELPVLTCTGNSFAGRVATSLLTAIDLPELITADLKEYEQRALALALHPDLLSSLRDKLKHQRDSAPLFATDRYRRDLEHAYLTLWQRWQHDQLSKKINVALTERDA